MKHLPIHTPELVETASLTVTQMARASRVDESWIIQRVSHGILQLDNRSGDEAAATPPHPGEVQAWRFSARTLLRARRIAELERAFDADPELAALTADLMEEVRWLRRQLEQGGGR